MEYGIGEIMLELAILIVVIVLLVTYKASLKYLAKGTSAQVNSWALETEANATEKVSKIKKVELAVHCPDTKF